MEDFNKIAETWPDKAWAQDFNFNMFIRHFIGAKNDDMVLDVGTGTGALIGYVAGEIYGCDISEEMLNKNPLPTRYKALCEDYHLPYSSNTFDVVFSRNLLKHVKDRPRIIKEMYRVLKKGGRLITIESVVFDGVNRDIPTELIRMTHDEPDLFPYLSDIVKLHGKISIVRTYQWFGWWFTRWKHASGLTEPNAQTAYDLYMHAPDDFKRAQYVLLSEDDICSIIDFAFVESVKQ